MTSDGGDWRDETSWVLDHGLPTDLPAELPRGLLVPIAYWIGVGYGAVMSLRWSSAPDNVDTEVKVYRRYGDEWDETGTEGGSDWPESRLVPLGVEPRHCLFSHLHGEGYHDSAIVTVDGIVGTDAVTVQALDRHGSVRHPVDSPVGAVLALVEPRSEATVTVFDGAGRILGGVIVDWEHSMTPMPAER